MRKVALLLGVLLVASAAGAVDDTASGKFKSFCAEWMKKLEVREKDNRAAIRWQAGPGGVQGEFVGYSQDHVCKLKTSKKAGSTPIGKIIYREVRYRQAGASTAEALKHAPRPIEATEVTEIFRYSRGKWVY